MIMSAVGFLSRNPDPAPKEIAEGLEGNLCRCGTYNRVVDAVQTAARELQSEDGS
jgi:aerobic-type carbon monoxide dehydrogenase small subunit (CoxS/CutS family)